MDKELINSEMEKVEEYYYEDLDKDMEELDNKTFQNRTKALATMMDQKNKEDSIALENRKLDFEIEQSKLQLELEKQKLEVEKQKNEFEIKNEKKKFWLNVGKLVIAVGSCIASVLYGIWSLVAGMKFEETNSWRTSTGKRSEQLTKNVRQDIDNMKKLNID